MARALRIAQDRVAAINRVTDVPAVTQNLAPHSIVFVAPEAVAGR